MNLSQDSTFPAHLRNCNWEFEKNNTDIVDLLPSDPFGMDVASTFSAITRWIGDIDKSGFHDHEFENDEIEVKSVDDQFLAGLYLIWNNAMGFHRRVGNTQADASSFAFASCKELQDGLFDHSLECNIDVKNYKSFSHGKYCMLSEATGQHDECTPVYSDCEGTSPEVLRYALGYLSVKDLLSIERVCKYLCDAVQNDSTWWRNILIDQPLSNSITDDALSRLTSRAQGGLQSLTLVDCLKITDNGLKSVLESNPGLKKLSVPGCLRLNISGILHNLKLFKSIGRPGITHLRIGGRSGITHMHFEELKLLVGLDKENNHSASKPRFYGGGRLYLSFDDDRALDIETCPMCQRPGEVYDCPDDNCKVCRACTLCIARCINCGCCLEQRKYEETFFLDFICFDCLKIARSN